MELLIVGILGFLLGAVGSIVLLGSIWYNGTLEVAVDNEHGDDARLEILEYDKVRTNKFMILNIHRKYK